MSPDEGPVEIVVCLGSSCFARGNSENLALINSHVQCHGLKAEVRMTGKLCQDECMQGPNLSIDGEVYHGVTPARLLGLLERLGGADRGQHGTS
jgi:NADH:ubiquinone oxidoreductase subunit E